MKSLSRVRLFATAWTVACQAPLSMEFSGKSTGVGCHFLLQGIFPTQGLNLGLPHCRQTLYHLSHQGTPSVTQMELKNVMLHKISRQPSSCRLTPFTRRSRNGKHWQWQSSDPQAVTQSSTGTYREFLVIDMPSLDLSIGYTNESIWQKSSNCILTQGYILLIPYVNRIPIKLIF